MNLSKALKHSYEYKRSMRFSIQGKKVVDYDGVVVHMGKSIVVFKEVKDFEFDGYVCVPKKNVIDYRDNEYDEVCNQILKNNGELKTIKKLRWMSTLNTMKDFVAACHKRKDWPIVETLENKDTYFFLGAILECSRSHFSLWSYDAAGNWEDAFNINYKDILRVEIESQYCDHFNMYMNDK